MYDADPRASVRIRSNHTAVLISPADCEAIFFRYSKAAAAAGGTTDLSNRSSVTGARPSSATARDGQVLTYGLFLAALVHAASLLKRPEVPFISEGLREYLQRHLVRAERVAPAAASSSSRSKGGGMSGASASSRGSELGVATRATVPAGQMEPLRHRKTSASGGVSSSGGASNGRKSGGSSARGRPPSVRRLSATGAAAGGGGGREGDAQQGFRGFGAGAQAVASFGGPDSASSGIERELSMLGLQSSSGGAGAAAAIPVRRGGGFELP